jgi:hypothetical protein
MESDRSEIGEIASRTLMPYSFEHTMFFYSSGIEFYTEARFSGFPNQLSRYSLAETIGKG